LIVESGCGKKKERKSQGTYQRNPFEVVNSIKTQKNMPLDIPA
jgi:hypothetical protein